MRRYLLLGATSTLFVTRLAIAQQPASPVQSGTRVRLVVVDSIDEATGNKYLTVSKGTVANLDTGSVVLQSQPAKAAETLRIPVAKILYGETFAGMQRHAIQGGVAGVAVGAIVGYVVADLGKGAGETCTTIGGSIFCSTSRPTPSRRAATSMAGAGVGALVGAGIGYLVRTERWATFDVASLHVRVGVR